MKRLRNGRYRVALEVAEEVRSEKMQCRCRVRIVKVSRNVVLETTRAFDAKSGLVFIRLMYFFVVFVLGVV